MDNSPFYTINASIKNYANGGVVLIAVSLLAMLLANSDLSHIYFSWWEIPVSLQIGDFNLFSHHGKPMTLMQFINDALMAIFFFSVGLEIKREILVGELSSVKQALFPVIAACGGMIVPIILFRILAAGDPEMLKGSAIPMATDIAFSLGVLSMMGKRVPVGLKIFLATLAVVDDIGGILVIAIFYSAEMQLHYLMYALVFLILLIIGAKKGVNSKVYYLFIGVIVWFMFLNSGIHPTIAGVIVAFCVPARPVMDTRKYIERIRENIAQFPASESEKGDVAILTKEQINLLKSVESASDRVISPLQDLEDSLKVLVNFVILPLFAFANAGVSLDGMMASDIFKGVSVAVFTGLVAGKFIGIFSFSFLAIKLKWADLPSGVHWKTLIGVSMLGGIGFTVSMFIANLSYGQMPGIGMELLNQAKIGIIMGSIISGFIGYAFLSAFLPKKFG